VTGIVLAGGRSERMGVAKALLRLNGETFLQRAVSVLSDPCERVIVVAAQGQPVPDLVGCKIVTDEEPGLGPLGGLVTGFAASGDQWHLVLACDLPLARPDVLRLLIGGCEGVDAVVPRTGGRLQPLLAAYSAACMEAGRQALAGGQRAVAAMLDRVKLIVLEEEALRRADPDLISFFNVNTWEEYQDARRLYSERSGAPKG